MIPRRDRVEAVMRGRVAGPRNERNKTVRLGVKKPATTPEISPELLIQ